MGRPEKDTYEQHRHKVTVRLTEEQYELWSIYLASAGEVIEHFGFVAFVPVLFRLFRPKSRRRNEEEIIDETSEEAEIC